MKSIREKVNTKLSKGYNLIQDVKYGIPYWYFENKEGHKSKYPYINDDIVCAELLDIPMTLRNYSIEGDILPTKTKPFPNRRGFLFIGCVICPKN